MCETMADIQSPTAENRRTKKRLQNMAASATQGGHNELSAYQLCITVLHVG